VKVSAYRIVFGFDDVAQLDPALRAEPARDRYLRLTTFNDAIRHDITTPVGVIGTPSTVPVYYLAAILLLAVAGAAVALRQLEMVGAIVTIAGGLWALCGWTGALVHAQRALQAGSKVVYGGAGVSLLAAAGVIALAAGIGALIWGDPGGFRAPRTLSMRTRGEVPRSPGRIALPTARLLRRSRPR
jgi:hypothetical protein